MKKQFLMTAVIGAVAIGSMVAIGEAEAATIVKNGVFITDINALQVGSTTYNVQFSNANFTSLFGPETPPSTLPTFWQSESGASAAAAAVAINAVLNGGEFGSVFLGNAASYLIPYNLVPGQGNSENVQAVLGSQNSVPAWISGLTTAPRNGGGNQPVYAVFSQVPSTAIPTPALLPGLIGMGVATLRKKKKAQEA
jgi:hypothetical protein